MTDSQTTTRCRICGDPATTTPCSIDCEYDLALAQGHLHDYPTACRYSECCIDGDCYDCLLDAGLADHY